MCCPQFTLNLEVDLDNDPGSFGGSATNRKCTDVWGLIPMVLFFGAAIALSAYCISNSEVEKLLNGYDDNGNICGKDNARTVELGKNMELKKYVLITEDAKRGKTKECVENCTIRNAFLIGNYCVKDGKFVPFFIEMKQQIVFYGISFALNLLICLCYGFGLPKIYIKDSKYLVPLTLVAAIIFLALLVILYLKNKNDLSMILLVILLIIGAVMIIATVLYVPMFCAKQMLLKRDLLLQLYEEIYEFSNVRILYFLPTLSCIFIFVLITIVIYCCLWVQSFSYPEPIYTENEMKINYIQYPIARLTQALVIYAAYLLYELVKNFQCMIVGGYVAEWYFTRRDGAAPDPIKRSLVNLLKYHLGTVCWGSILLPLIYVLRALMNGIKGAASGYNNESVCTCSCRLLSQTCLSAFLPCLDFFSQNAFIMTSMNGCNFCAGTTRAHKLISHNSFNAASLNPMGDFYLESFKFFAIFQTCLVSFFFFNYFFQQSFQEWMMRAGIFLFSYILVDCYFSVLKVIKDAIFLCFCEDCLYNNGTSKPYHMSKNFAQFVENANQLVDPVKWKDSADKWDKGPKRLN